MFVFAVESTSLSSTASGPESVPMSKSQMYWRVDSTESGSFTVTMKAIGSSTMPEGGEGWSITGGRFRTIVTTREALMSRPSEELTHNVNARGWTAGGPGG